MDKEKPETEAKLPKWQSHKQVFADRIIDIQAMAVRPDQEQPVPNYAGADWVLECGIRVHVTTALIARGAPKIGDFYVHYKDGYQSWSPAAAFMEGYTRVYD